MSNNKEDFVYLYDQYNERWIFNISTGRAYHKHLWLDFGFYMNGDIIVGGLCVRAKEEPMIERLKQALVERAIHQVVLGGT